MLSKMTGVLTDSPSNTTQDVQMTARAVAGLTQISDELTPAAQVQAKVNFIAVDIRMYVKKIV